MSIIKQVEALEKSFNKFWTKLTAWLNVLFSKLIPKKVKIVYEKTSNKTKAKLNNFSNQVSQKAKQLPGKFKQHSQKISELSHKVSHNLEIATSKAKSFNIKKVSGKAIFGGLFATILALLLKVKTWYLSLRPEAFLGIIVTATVGSLAGVNIYKSSQKIIEETSKGKAELVEKVEMAIVPSRRPGYYNLERKTFLVAGLVMPVNFEETSGANDINSLMLDVEIVCSNRYIREYFLKNEHVLKDKINKTFRPIIPSFPLSREGKDIVKEKLIKEMNALIKELGIDGEIKEIHLVNVIAS